MTCQCTGQKPYLCPLPPRLKSIRPFTIDRQSCSFSVLPFYSSLVHGVGPESDDISGLNYPLRFYWTSNSVKYIDIKMINVSLDDNCMHAYTLGVI